MIGQKWVVIGGLVLSINIGVSSIVGVMGTIPRIEDMPTNILSVGLKWRFNPFQPPPKMQRYLEKINPRYKQRQAKKRKKVIETVMNEKQKRKKVAREIRKGKPPSWKVNSIWVINNEYKALISGKIVSKGDIFENTVVDEITEESVTLKYKNNNKVVLRIKKK